jgi:hypothetical protein
MTTEVNPLIDITFPSVDKGTALRIALDGAPFCEFGHPALIHCRLEGERSDKVEHELR